MNHFIWDFDPILLSLGNFKIHWYGACFALAISLAYWLMLWMFKNEEQDLEALDPLLYYLVAGVLIGARLGHCLFYEPELYLSNPLEMLKIWKGGLASHGAVLGIFIALFIFVKRKPQFKFLYILDRLSVSAMVASAFIRLGNFFNSEIIGHPTEQAWGIIFKRRDLIARHPSQLYEMLVYFLVFIVLLLVYNLSRAKRYEGLLSGITLVLVFSSRFFLEFYKTKQSEWAQDQLLSAGQWLSIPLVIVGGVLIARVLLHKREVQNG